MIDPATLSYVAVTTGTVGMITGIVGAITGVAANRRAKLIKSLDLRLELRKEVVDTRALIEQLPKLLGNSKDSRVAVSSALGTARSGGFEAWLDGYKKDMASARELAKRLPDPSDDFRSLSHRKLEAEMVRIHELKGKAAALDEKARAALAEDARDRERIAREQFERSNRRT